MNGYAIVLASEELEKIQAASMIGSVAAVSDVPVELFVTMNALNAFEKETVENGSFVVGQVGEYMLGGESGEMSLFTDQLAQGKEIGPLSVYACSMAMDVQGKHLDDYVDVFDEELGIAGFLQHAADKNVIFI